MTIMMRSIIAVFLLAISSFATAQEPEAVVKKTTKPAIHDTKADAREQVKTATVLAHRDGRRTLIMFGFNGCGWCHGLHDLFASDQAIRSILTQEYVVVMVDIQSPNVVSLLDECKAARAPDELKKSVGYPFLAVLDGDGKVLIGQRTDPLELRDGHDPEKVKVFLEKWTAPKLDAAKVLADGLSKASSEDKLGFLHLGSPTRGWCHQLDGFLAREDIRAIIGRDFVDMKLDLARMTGADEIFKKYNAEQSGGIPWFVFTNAKGNAIVNSDGPKGNIGYPATPEEIGYFVTMLVKVARKITPAQINEIESALRAEGKQIEQTRANVVR